MNGDLKVALRFSVRWLAPFVGAVTAIVVLARTRDVPVSLLLRDPANAFDLPWYVGALSMIGVMLWVAAAAVAWFGWWTSRPTGSRLLLALAWSSSVLAIDDALLLREGLGPVLGVPEEVVLAAIGILVVVPLALVLPEIARHSARSILLMSLAALATSLYQDVAGQRGWPRLPGSVVAEDLAKLVGIMAWLAFTWIVAASSHRAADEPVTTRTGPRAELKPR